MLDRVSSFVGSHDRRFLRELVYRILDSMDDKLKKVYVAERYDNADWIAAATMLIPLEMSKQISFITYTGSPDRCFHKVAGLFDTDDLSPMVSMFSISSGDFKESDRDELFDSYVDSAYSEGSDRQAFFEFLSRVGWKEVGKGIIDAYNMFCVCEKNIVPPEKSCLRCLDALKKTIVSAKDGDIVSVYNVVKGRMDPDMADFFGNTAVPRMNDKEAANRILAEVASYTLEPSRSIVDGAEVVSSYSKYKDTLMRCVNLGALDLVDYPAARYYCYKASAETGDQRLSQIVAGYGELDDVFIDALCSDGTCVEALGKQSPLSDAAKSSLKNGILSRAGGLPSALLGRAFEFGLDEDHDLAHRLSEAILQREDRQAMEKTFIDAAIGKGDNSSATVIASRHVDSIVQGGGDLASTIRYMGQRASSLDWKCSASLLSALSKSIDFTGFGPLPAVREAMAAYPDMEGMVTSEEASRIRLLSTADVLSKEGAGTMDLSSLTADERKAFVKLSMSTAIPKKEADKWVENRMKLYSSCPDEAASRMGTIVSHNIQDRFDADTVVSFIKSAKSIGASDESIYSNLRMDGKQAGKVRKLLEGDMLEGFNKLFKESEDSHKGFFSKSKDDDEKSDKQPKKGGLLGFLKRRWQ